MDSLDRLRILRAKLADAETELAALFDSSDDFVCLLSGEGCFQRLNCAWQVRLGHVPDEMLARPVADLVHSDDAAATCAALARLSGEPEIQFENRVRHADGTFRRLSWTASPWNSDGLVCAIAREICDPALAAPPIPSRFAQLLESLLLASTHSLDVEAARELAEQSAIIYRTVVETSPDAITITDMQGQVLTCNLRGAAIHGFDSVDEMIGSNAFEYIAPEDRERAVENARKTLDEGSVRNIEYTLLRKDGGSFPGELSASVIRDAEGEPRAFIGVVRDISERKRTEEAFLKEKAFSDSTIDSLPGIFYLFDDQGRFLRWNKNAEEITGYSTEEIVNMNPLDFFVGDDKALIAQRIREALAQGRSTAEAKLVTKDGRQIPYFFTGLRAQIEDTTYLAGMAIDLTERKLAEEALRASEERYRALYQDNPTMYFTVDAQGTILSVNQFGAEQLGYSVEELVGQPVLKVFYEQDKSDVSEQLSSCLSKPGRVAHWEFRKVRKGGDVIWVKEAARATENADGDPIVLIVCEDITERKRMEEEVQRVREELEGKVERQMRGEDPYGLTFRELTILHLVAAGKPDKEIGTTLGISPLTVSKHVANILAKMGAASRSEASARAVREALLE